ncbi:DNA-binding protein [bacterium]|nr:DNA-binding protein [bacterium]
MTLEDIKKRLVDAGLTLTEEKAIQHGTGLRFNNGSIVNVFDTGKFSVQGKEQDRVNEILGQGVLTVNGAPDSGTKRVFVVYGHDTQSRTQLEAMLRRWGLEPLILDQLPSEGQTIIEKLESYTTETSFAVVLATPDDQGHRANHPDELLFRARQNVVLELGMLLSKLGRHRVAILLKEQEKIERPSDIHGLIYIPFKDDLAKEAGLTLAKEMVAQGFQIDISRI